MLPSPTHRFHTLLITPFLLPLIFALNGRLISNQPPIANPDHYAVHRSFSTPTDFKPYGVLRNDSDPDNDPLSCVFTSVTTNLGQATVYANGIAEFTADYGKTGTVTIPYTVCDNHGACANSTVTFDVTNQPPVANADSYTVHGTFETPIESPRTGVLKNDSDPENDPLSCIAKRVDVTLGTALIFSNGKAAFIPADGQTGDLTITYTVCDNLGACAEGTVSFHLVNQPPVAGGDAYIVRGSEFETPLETPNGVLKNDSDPESDPIHTGFVRADFPQGTAFVSDTGKAVFVRNSGYPNYLSFSGSFSLQYPLCDNLGACSQGTVTFWLIGDGENDGLCSSCPDGGGTIAVGGPINVTNGNMYLRQNDYALPGVGPAIDVSRTFNSNSQRTALFGKGWSSQYDESITVYDNSLVRLNSADGRAIYFGRPSGSSGAFSTLEGDIHASLVKNGGNGFTLRMKDGSVDQFNSSGRVLSMADRNGNQTTLSYDANEKLTSITDPFSRVLSVTTNANGQILSISDALGTVANYVYGMNSQLLSVTYGDNSGFQFTYDGNLKLTATADALGNVVDSHTYDSQGRAMTSEKQGGVEHYSLNYVSAVETDVTDGLGRVTKYTFDTSKGRNVVTKVEGVCSCGGGGAQVRTWSYDDKLNITSKTDALGHVTSYTYDTNGNPLTIDDPTGTVRNTYNLFSQVLTSANQLGDVTTNVYDAQGNLLTTNDALNNTTTMTYDSHGQPLTVTDARIKVTTFTYDISGNLTQRRDANNITTFFFYDARSRLTKVRDGLSRSSLFAYDPYGRISKVTHPDLSFVSFTYDLAGRRTAVTDERGYATNYSYDGAYRLTATTDALSHATSYGYDAMSNLISLTDALTHATSYDYDDFNRPVKITYPRAANGATRLFESFVYNAMGNVTQHSDAAGRVTNYVYDNAERVASVTDPDLKTTNFEYDALGRVTAVVDALNQRYQFAYDPLGRQTQITRAGIPMTYAYDAVGNRTQRTDYNGSVTNYGYDNLNRLTTITYPTRTVTYSYDPLNNLTRATNENGSVYIGYDNRYRVSSLSDPFFYGISYNYDAAGNRTRLKVNGVTYASYTYDTVNRLVNLADSANLSFSYSYDAANRLTARSAPNGVTSSYAYDDLDRLTGMMHAAGATTLSGNLYTYNNANNISSWTTASAQRAYTYDALNRLTGASNFELPTENYSYDAVGNRTASHLSTSYSYQPFNKLMNTASANYSYDNNGNLVHKTDAAGTWDFYYDEENRLTQVTLPTGSTVNYKYDGLGRRIQRTTNHGASERYIYDGLIDLNADWSVATTYLNGPGIDNHLRQTSATTGVSYFLTDHLGSTAGLTDTSANLVEQPSYDSFGNSAGSPRTRYGYTGRERDPDTGLLYYRARFYDPQLGRFISEDPIGAAGGSNQFAYVENNALVFSDPQGLWPSRGLRVHQRIISRVLNERATPEELRILMQEQADFDDDTQDEVYAYQHAMRMRGERPEDARRKANRFVRQQICIARRLAAKGQIADAMHNLGRAIHTLQDSTSPAHANFAVAWENSWLQTINHLPHYATENFDPGPDSVADYMTLKAWRYFTGEDAMPNDFFGDVFDIEHGRAYFRATSAPDGGSCDCL